MSNPKLGRIASGFHPESRSGHKPARANDAQSLRDQADALEIEERENRLGQARTIQRLFMWSVIASVFVVAIIGLPLNISHFAKLFTYMGIFAEESPIAFWSNIAAAILATCIGVAAGAGVGMARGGIRLFAFGVTVAAIVASWLATGMSLQGTAQSALDGAARSSRAAQLSDAGLEAARTRLEAARSSLTSANTALSDAAGRMKDAASMGEFNRRQKGAYDERIAAAQAEMQAANAQFQQALAASQTASSQVAEGPAAVFATAASQLFGDRIDGKGLMFWLNQLISTLITISPIFAGMLAAHLIGNHVQTLRDEADKKEGKDRSDGAQAPVRDTQPVRRASAPEEAAAIPVKVDRDRLPPAGEVVDLPRRRDAHEDELPEFLARPNNTPPRTMAAAQHDDHVLKGDFQPADPEIPESDGQADEEPAQKAQKEEASDASRAAKEPEDRVPNTKRQSAYSKRYALVKKAVTNPKVVKPGDALSYDRVKELAGGGGRDAITAIRNELALAKLAYWRGTRLIAGTEEGASA